jgi:bifunctional non-homologous end joining protein LigD
VDRPDQLVLDLDPDESLPWSAVVEAALETRALLEELGLESFVKTTGGKGLHLVVPIQRRSSWDDAKQFGHAIALAMTAARPDRYIAVTSKARRAGKIFIDYLRNAQGASAIAPYSTRATEGAPVATPLSWKELDSGVDPASFTVTSVPRRLSAPDPWRGYDRVRQSITATMMRRLEQRLTGRASRR